MELDEEYAKEQRARDLNQQDTKVEIKDESTTMDIDREFEVGQTVYEIEKQERDKKYNQGRFVILPPDRFKLSDLYPFRYLQELTIQNLPTKVAVQVFLYFSDKPIQSLNLARYTCNLSELQDISNQSFFYRELRTLNLSGVVRATSTFQQLLIERCPKLNNLTLACTGLTTIAPLVKKLYSLDVQNNYLGKSSINSIVSSGLIELNITNNDFTDADVRQLADSSFLSVLQVGKQRIHSIKPETLLYIDMKMNKPRLERYEEMRNRQEEENAQIEIAEMNADEGDVLDFRSMLKSDPNRTEIEGTILPISAPSLLRKFTSLTKLNVVINGENISDPFVLDVMETIVSLKSLVSLKIRIFIFEDPDVEESDNYMTLPSSIGESIAQLPYLREFKFYPDVNVLTEPTFWIKLLKTSTIRSLAVSQLPITKQVFKAFMNNYSLWPWNLNNAVMKRIDSDLRIRGASKKLAEHLKENKSSQLALQKIVPTIIGMQLGGSFRNSIIDLLPMIYNFADINIPSEKETKEIMQQTEPAPVKDILLRRSKRKLVTGQPLPMIVAGQNIDTKMETKTENEPPVFLNSLLATDPNVTVIRGYLWNNANLNLIPKFLQLRELDITLDIDYSKIRREEDLIDVQELRQLVYLKNSNSLEFVRLRNYPQSYVNTSWASVFSLIPNLKRMEIEIPGDFTEIELRYQYPTRMYLEHGRFVTEK